MNFSMVTFVNTKNKNVPVETIYHPGNETDGDSYLEVRFPTSRAAATAVEDIKNLVTKEYPIAFCFGDKMNKLFSKQVLAVPFIHNKQKANDYIRTLRHLQQLDYDSHKQLHLKGEDK